MNLQKMSVSELENLKSEINIELQNRTACIWGLTGEEEVKESQDQEETWAGETYIS